MSDETTRNFKGQACGYESYNLLSLDKVRALDVVDISRKGIEREKQEQVNRIGSLNSDVVLIKNFQT